MIQVTVPMCNVECRPGMGYSGGAWNSGRVWNYGRVWRVVVSAADSLQMRRLQSHGSLHRPHEPDTTPQQPRCKTSRNAA